LLFEFLIENHQEILDECKGKMLSLSASKPSSEALDRGLPIFLSELTGVLRRALQKGPDYGSFPCGATLPEGSAAMRGKESLRLGYTVGQVVHAYGAVCQTIMEMVQKKKYKITAEEFRQLNFCLDCAIAEAVTEFEAAQSSDVERGETEKLGFLLHELGNSLAAAMMAQDMIKQGKAGIAGSTSHVLEHALDRMQHILDKSLVEVRLRGAAPAELSSVRLIDVVSAVEASALVVGKSKGVRLEIDVDPAIELTADPHMIYSALSNLVSNGMKFTKNGGAVRVTGKESDGHVIIDVKDECGGIPGKTEDLFKPFVQKGADKSGLGLGLSLSRQAVEFNHGSLSARNMGHEGCVFTIDLPKCA